MKSLMRICLLSLVLGGAIYAGFLKLVNNHYEEIRAVEAKNQELREDLKVREQMIERLSRSRRVAMITPRQ